MVVSRISGSGLYIYNLCKRRFFYQYVARIPFVEEANVHLMYGRVMNNYIQNELVEEQQEVDYTEVSDSKYNDAFFNHMLLVDSKVKEIQKLKNLEVERHFEREFNGVIVNGYLDVDSDDDIVEIKTKAGKWTKTPIRRTWQFRIYNNLATREKKDFRLLQLNKNKHKTNSDKDYEVLYETIKWDDPTFEEELKEILDSMTVNEDDYDYCDSSWSCRGCPFKKMCDRFSD